MTHPTIPLASKTRISRQKQESKTFGMNFNISNSLKYLRPMFSEMLPLHGWYLNPAGSFKEGWWRHRRPGPFLATVPCCQREGWKTHRRSCRIQRWEGQAPRTAVNRRDAWPIPS